MLNISADLQAHRREFARAVANKHYERAGDGRILFPRQKAFLHGVMVSTINGKDPQVDPNIIPTEGLNYMLDVGVHDATKVSTWYTALFNANTTPQDTLTGVNFATQQTEYTGYAETARVTYVEAAASAGATSNTASRAEFTIVTPTTVYGAALLSSSTKGDNTGKILACSKFSAGRSVILDDLLQILYSLSLSSA
jgi:hypothetical protein